MIDVGNCWPAAAYDDLLDGLLVKRGFVYSVCLFGMEWNGIVNLFLVGGWKNGFTGKQGFIDGQGAVGWVNFGKVV